MFDTMFSWVLLNPPKSATFSIYCGMVNNYIGPYYSVHDLCVVYMWVFVDRDASLPPLIFIKISLT